MICFCCNCGHPQGSEPSSCKNHSHISAKLAKILWSLQNPHAVSKNGSILIINFHILIDTSSYILSKFYQNSMRGWVLSLLIRKEVLFMSYFCCSYYKIGHGIFLTHQIMKVSMESLFLGLLLSNFYQHTHT